MDAVREIISKSGTASRFNRYTGDKSGWYFITDPDPGKRQQLRLTNLNFNSKTESPGSTL